MNSTAGIIVAFIGAIAAIVTSFFTAQSTANMRVNDVDTKVQVLEERQLNQYQELSASVGRIEEKLDRIVPAK